MQILSKYNKIIESRNWDHLKFLQSLLITLLVFLLILYLWILVLISKDTLPITVSFISDFSKYLAFSIIGGIIYGFIILLPMYIKKIWDLHKITPIYLIFLLIATIIIVFLQFTIIMQSGIIIGGVIGGLITIIAYAGEIKKEHMEQ